MSKKFSILRSVDINKLDKQIDSYRCETGEQNPYLFMSNSTGDAIMEELLGNIPICPTGIEEMLKLMAPGVKVGTYKGVSIYENNDLEFGEVEIR